MEFHLSFLIFSFLLNFNIIMILQFKFITKYINYYHSKIIIITNFITIKLIEYYLYFVYRPVTNCSQIVYIFSNIFGI